MRCFGRAPTPSSSGRRSRATRTPRENYRSCGMVEASVLRKKGRFGQFGGQYVPETLMPALHELEEAYEEAKVDPSFREELESYYRHYGGRPTPAYFARRLTEHIGGARIYLKREGLCHGGPHKLNNVMGQALLGLPVEVYMGSVDVKRQSLNVFSMRLLGAAVHEVSEGTRTMKDAINEALRDWVTNVATTYYLLGSVVGPHPYPTIVRDFQSVIGGEIREQSKAQIGRLPDVLVACVGGGSNAMGTFAPFLN